MITLDELTKDIKDLGLPPEKEFAVLTTLTRAYLIGYAQGTEKAVEAVRGLGRKQK